jgi:hypothetical protein
MNDKATPEWERGYNDGCSAVTADLNIIKDTAEKVGREKVLKLVYDRYVNAYLNPDNYNEINAKEVYQYIESLRGK